MTEVHNSKPTVLGNLCNHVSRYGGTFSGASSVLPLRSPLPHSPPATQNPTKARRLKRVVLVVVVVVARITLSRKSFSLPAPWLLLLLGSGVTKCTAQHDTRTKAWLTTTRRPALLHGALIFCTLRRKCLPPQCLQLPVGARHVLHAIAAIALAFLPMCSTFLTILYRLSWFGFTHDMVIIIIGTANGTLLHCIGRKERTA